MRKLTLLAWLALAYLHAYANFSPGDLMFIAYDSDNQKGFAVVALAEIPTGDAIYFSDKRWTGGAFQDLSPMPLFAEGFLVWINDTGQPIPEGKVLLFTHVNDSNTLTVNLGAVTRIDNFDPSNSADVIYMYQGADYAHPSVFLSAITNSSLTPLIGTLNNTDLELGENAFRLLGNVDVMIYSGPTVFTGSKEDCAKMLSDPNNWTAQNTASNTDDEDGVYPDFPVDVTIDFSFSILPIELVYFKAILEAHTVTLQWQTATEQNNDFMAVERSMDGRNYVEIGRVGGQGNSWEVHNYQLTDAQPLSGTNYYRLRQVDYDGTATISAVVAIEVERITGNEWRLFPVPAAESISLVLPQPSILPMTLKVFDTLGAQVLSHTAPKGSEKVDLQVGQLPHGQYILQGSDQDKTVSLPFVKQ